MRINSKITQDDIQGTLRHNRKDIHFDRFAVTVAGRLEGSLNLAGADKALLIENIYEAVEDLEMEGWRQQLASSLPSGALNPAKKK